MNEFLKRQIEKELLLFLHPIYSVKGEQLIAYEVLARLKQDEEYFNPPHFLQGIDIKYHYILARAVLKQIPNILECLPNKGIKLHVNFNPEDLKDNIVQSYIRTLKDSIIVEIMEDSNNIQDIVDILQEMVKNEITIALDDFGDKNSTHNYIVDASENYNIFSIVKIDGSLVKDIQDKPHKFLFLKRLISILKKDNQKICIEWIDTPRKLEMALELGADQVQGFLYGHPFYYKELITETRELA